ncbi:Yip1 domain protein [Anatilimnocola aggregata]|uniref:Yip1 domain protein n=2 Tax=Anatilimnocola aggregata TaxID=2528021 RepID=A0A517Y5Z2_9BACT|nr:Yip1 domain protein [Anatilimnocola aggregata]
MGLGTWFETLKLILFEMNEAFRRMKPTGGHLVPILFFLSCSTIFWTYNLVLQAGMGALQAGGGGDDEFVWEMLSMAFGMGILCLLMPIFCYLGAALLHGCLYLVGGANLGFETTLRVMAYSLGGMCIVAMVPCVGSCVFFVWGIACLANALMEAQRCTTGQGIGAVALMIVVLVGSAFVLVVGALALNSLNAFQN